jgi:hypothetical protein
MISHDEDANYRWGFRRLRSWPAHWLSANDIADLAAADAAVAGTPAPESETASMPLPAAPKAEVSDATPRKTAKKPPRARKPRPSQRARTLLREQLADGPRPGAQIEATAEAAEIPPRALIAAADVLGVRTRKGQWWLP